MARRRRCARRGADPDAVGLVFSCPPGLDGVMAPPTPTPRCMVRVAAGPRLGYGHLMRARSLTDHLAMQVAVSVRGGRDAARTATSMGFRLASGTAALDRMDLLIVDDPSLKNGRPWIR